MTLTADGKLGESMERVVAGCGEWCPLNGLHHRRDRPMNEDHRPNQRRRMEGPRTPVREGSAHAVAASLVIPPSPVIPPCDTTPDNNILSVLDWDVYTPNSGSPGIVFREDEDDSNDSNIADHSDSDEYFQPLPSSGVP